MTIQVIGPIPNVLYPIDFFDKLNQKRNIIYLELNLSTFEQQCQMLNNLLMEKNCFLVCTNLCTSFATWSKKTLQKNQVQKIFSPVSKKKCNGFEIVRKLVQEERQIFKHLNIIYKPVRKLWIAIFYRRWDRLMVCLEKKTQHGVDSCWTMFWLQ